MEKPEFKTVWKKSKNSCIQKLFLALNMTSFLINPDEELMNLLKKIYGQHRGEAVHDLIFVKKTPLAQWQALFNGSCFHVHIFSKMCQQVAHAYSQGMQEKKGTPQLKTFLDEVL